MKSPKRRSQRDGLRRKESGAPSTATHASTAASRVLAADIVQTFSRYGFMLSLPRCWKPAPLKRKNQPGGLVLEGSCVTWIRRRCYGGNRRGVFAEPTADPPPDLTARLTRAGEICQRGFFGILVEPKSCSRRRSRPACRPRSRLSPCRKSSRCRSGRQIRRGPC